DCFIAGTQLLVVLTRPEHSRGSEKESGSGESRRGPAREIGPPVDRNPNDSGTMLRDVGHDATFEGVPIRAFGGRCVRITEQLRDLRIALVVESQIGTIVHTVFYPLRFPSSPRSFCLA